MFLKIIAWIITIILLLLGTLVVIGLMASPRQTGPSFRGFGPEDAEEKVRK
jgi:hypothetical protein